MEPARPVPPYERQQVSSAWYYCLHCRHSEPTEFSTRSHIRTAHEIEDMYAGEDYTNGTHLRILIERWEEWSMLMVNQFQNQVASLRGADDLELDVGRGMPEVAYPKLPKKLKPKPPAPPPDHTFKPPPVWDDGVDDGRVDDGA